MSLFNGLYFPWTQNDGFNLDSFAKIINDLRTAWNEFELKFGEIDFETYTKGVIDDYVRTGTFPLIVNKELKEGIEAYLSEHLTPTTPTIDDTLSIQGAGADAKKVGERFNDISERSRNLFNDKGEINYNSNGTIGTNNLNFIDEDGFHVLVSNSASNGRGYKVFLNEGDITLSFNVKSFGNGTRCGIRIYKVGESTAVLMTNLSTRKNIVHFHSEGGDYIIGFVSYGGIIPCNMILENIMLNYGNDALDFEPYYICIDHLARKDALIKPHLTNTEKTNIVNLVNDYYNNRNNFGYYADLTRNVLATGNMYDSQTNKVLTNCGLWVQNILMGRAVSDYLKPKTEYSAEVTKAFDGYYFDFLLRKAKGLRPDSDSYYGYHSRGEESFSWNSYVSGDGERQIFDNFMFADSLASELYFKGLEIEFPSLEVGDLVFFAEPNPISGRFESTAFRNIDHVGIVMRTGRPEDLVIAECTNTYGGGLVLIKWSLGYSGDKDIVKSAFMLKNIKMCARNPIALHAYNVPDVITEI